MPETYQGLIGEVVDVQLNKLERERSNIGKANALGETVDEKALVDPYIDIFVKFPDGVVAMTTTYPSLAVGDEYARLQFVEERNARANQLATQLQTVIGKTAYAVGYSRLYKPTASLEELVADERYSESRLISVPWLEPLTVVTAKYNEQHDIIILKLKGSDGAEYLTASKFRALDERQSFIDVVVSSSPASLITSFGRLTTAEIAAIRRGSIINGMSLVALYYSAGFPEKKNNWGRGGKQLIYFGGRILVY